MVTARLAATLRSINTFRMTVKRFQMTVPSRRSLESRGGKDTVDIPAGEVIRLLVRWTPTDVPVIPGESYAGQNLFKFDPTRGEYVWHCHLINHEDNEMMRPYRVVP